MNSECRDSRANGPIDEGVARSLAEWIDQYLSFAQDATNHEVRESWQAHRNTWHHLPELVMTIFNYKRYVGRRYPSRGDRR